ncbi:MAG: hypothetical protein J3Q66DRAFT_94405 [Benniella sp.]|nr:MAG: hypothetical protein J3Q66DRAFT_94405 [Benniella sp.]
MNDEYSKEDTRRFFEYEKPPASGAVVRLWGVSKPTLTAVTIPDETPSFVFQAPFSNRPAGSYVVRWRVKVLKNFSIPNELRFSVRVVYDAEEDTTGSFDMIMSHTELMTLDPSPEKGGTFDLELEELVVIQPYQFHNPHNKSQWSTVVVAMSNCESVDDKYSGLSIEHVELSPYTSSWPSATGVAIKHTVKRAVEPKFTIDIMGSSALQGYPHPLPITRLSWSKGNMFLAALALSENTAYITVWNMKDWDSSKPQDTTILRKNRAVATTKHQGGILKDLSIGLAISPNGRHVAVYQEPGIGQWADGSELNECEFHFRLLIPQPVQNVSNITPIIPIAAIAAIVPNTDVILDMKSAGAKLPKEDEDQTRPPHPTLRDFIGYGAFLTDKKTCSSDMSDFTNAHHAHEGSGVGNGVKASNDETSDRNIQSTAPSESFAACNGICLDIFKIKSELNWEHTHSITLTDLIPTINRRITCKVMMDTISSNKFMWLEDGGLCCTIWDLHKGSNVSYLFSGPDNTRLGKSVFRGDSTMSISPDESIVAIASADGALTTFYANTGIAISNKKFPGHRIDESSTCPDYRQDHSWILL